MQSPVGTVTRQLRERVEPTTFNLVYLGLTLFYGGLAVSYLFDSARSVKHFSQLDELLGGPSIPNVDVPPWRYAAVMGMGTLGLMCLMMLIDLRRNYPLLVPAVFFKGLNAVLWFVYWRQSDLPVFLFAGLVDVALVALMVVVARREYARIEAT